MKNLSSIDQIRMLAYQHLANGHINSVDDLINAFMPEIFLSIAVILGLIFISVTYNRQDIVYSTRSEVPLTYPDDYDGRVFWLSLFTLGSIIFALFLLNIQISSNVVYADFLVDSHYSTHIIKRKILVIALAILLIVVPAFRMQKIDAMEFFPIYLIIVLSSILLVSANNFMLIFLILETQSICFYYLATIKRDSPAGVDGGMTYFILGAIIGGVFLYAVAHIYGHFGTLNLTLIKLGVSRVLVQNTTLANISLAMSVLTLCIVFLFKFGIFPFNYWVVSVYESAPLAATIILSLVAKVPLVDLIFRISQVFGPYFESVQTVFYIAGLITVLTGNIYGVFSENLKRLFIQSSVAQSGILILLLGSSDVMANFPEVIFFFVFFYIMSSLLVWSIYYIINSRRSSISVDDFNRFRYNPTRVNKPAVLSDVANLISDHPFLALLTVVALFSFSGLPPLLGFYIKSLPYLGLVSNSLSNYIVAAILSVAALIAYYFYGNLIKTVLYEPRDPSDATHNRDQRNLSPTELYVLFAASIYLFGILQLFFYQDTTLVVISDVLLSR